MPTNQATGSKDTQAALAPAPEPNLPQHTLCTLILDTQKMSSPRSSPIGFIVPKRLKGATNSGGTVELENIILLPGPDNRLSASVVARLRTHPEFQRFVAEGVIRVLEPVVSEEELYIKITDNNGAYETGLTRDYGLRDALLIVRDSVDKEWLERSKETDVRGEVVKAIRERLAIIAKQEAKSQSAAVKSPYAGPEE